MVPPDTREGKGKDEEEFSINWEQLSAQQQNEHTWSPVEYPLKLATKMAMKEGRDEMEELSAVLPLICHRVKVQRS